MFSVGGSESQGRRGNFTEWKLVGVQVEGTHTLHSAGHWVLASGQQGEGHRQENPEDTRGHRSPANSSPATEATGEVGSS